MVIRALEADYLLELQPSTLLDFVSTELRDG
jgi:hypothetical protein